jgi:hypothetical protein
MLSAAILQTGSQAEKQILEIVRGSWPGHGHKIDSLQLRGNVAYS